MTHITTIWQIDTSLPEGKLLVAAITMLSNESLIPKSYNQIIQDANDLAVHMYGNQVEEQNEYTYSV